jgi:primosomal protein N' (replication factor Y)
MYLNELRCHYCGYIQNVPATCEACGSTKIKTLGFGTEKLEEDLKLFFPDASVERMDLETTKKKNSYQKIIQGFEERKTDILVGTQMVSKGLDFDHVHLVAIFDADRMIHFPDFRSYERAFQLMIQVSGRAGRREEKGRVIIQTNDPGQGILKKVQSQDYESFYQEEIIEREKFFYPPFSRIIRLTLKDPDRSIAKKASRKLADNLIGILGKERILGPEAPLIDKIRNNYLMEINIKLERNKINLSQVKEKIRNEVRTLLENKEFKNTQVVPDADPY